MVLLDTGRAIGAVTRLLRENIKANFTNDSRLARMDVTIGRPEPPSNPGDTTSGPRLNLFLYELHFDQYLKNTSLRDGDPIPVWLVLKYLLTAFDDKDDSDSPEAHDLLGQGIQSLQSLDYLPITSDPLSSPLRDSPELLHITFNDSSSDLLHNLMQGSDEKYRLSISFEVRPVMIAAAEVPLSSLLVGIDYTKNPVEPIKEKGINLPVTSSFVPTRTPLISSISPLEFEVNSIVRLLGSDLNLEPLTLLFGPHQLAVTSKQYAMIEFVVEGSVVNGNVISAGNQTIRVQQSLPNGNQISSNPIIGTILPKLISISKSLNRIDPSDSNSPVFGDVIMTGNLLGTEKDEIVVLLYKDGKKIKIFRNNFVLPTISPDVPPQTQLLLEIDESNAVSPGNYQVILVVNGHQAKNCPQVNFTIG